MTELEKILKQVNGYISIAESEKEQNKKVIEELYAEQDRSEHLPEELAKKGDEQGYKDARLHLEYISDRICTLEQRNDDLESKPLVSKETYNEMYKSLMHEYSKVEKSYASTFLDCVERLTAAQNAFTEVRNKCNSILYRINNELYWIDRTNPSGREYRKSAGVDRLVPTPMDTVVAAIADLNPGTPRAYAKAIMEKKS